MMTTLDTVQTLTLCGMFIVIVLLLRRVSLVWYALGTILDDGIDPLDDQAQGSEQG